MEDEYFDFESEMMLEQQQLAEAEMQQSYDDNVEENTSKQIEDVVGQVMHAPLLPSTISKIVEGIATHSSNKR